MASGNRISRQALNQKLKELPIPVQEHCKRCKMIATFLLDRIKVEDWFLDAGLKADYIASAVYLHDIGKASLPRDNLYAKHNLTKAKKTLYRSHVEEGVTLIEKLCDVRLSEFGRTKFEAYVLAAVTEHHESVDGCGFPGRLAADELSVTGKITAIADRVDNLFFVGNTEGASPEELTEQLAAMADTELDGSLLNVMLADREAFLGFIQYIDARYKTKRKTDGYGLQLHLRQIRNIIENEPREMYADFVINDPFYGIVKPEVFMPVAGMTSQAARLTLLMAERLCLALDRVKERGGEPMPVAMSVDAACFTAKRFASEMTKLLQKYAIRDNLICLVVNERSLLELEDVNYADIFGVLRAGGYRMALRSMAEDNTLLGRLDTLQLDYLFIDPSYTHRISVNANTFGVASGILEIAHNLHLSVVFLGCDTHAIEKALLKMHARFASGELYGESLRERDLVSGYGGQDQ